MPQNKKELNEVSEEASPIAPTSEEDEEYRNLMK